MTPELEKQIKELIESSQSKERALATRKVGDTPTDANQLVPKNYCDSNIIPVSSLFGTKGDLLVGQNTSVFGRLPIGTDGYVLTAASSSVFGVAWNPIPAQSFPNGLFGDGSDGIGSADGSTTLAGTFAPVSNIYTFTRDTYWTNLTISTGVTINPNGYQIFVQGTTTMLGTGTIARNGFNGSPGFNGANAGTVSGGGGGSVLAAGTLAGATGGVDGGTGGQSASSSNGVSGGNGGTGSDTNPSLGSSGQVGTTSTGIGGSAGAFTGGSPGSGGTGGTATAAKNNPHSLQGAYLHADVLDTYKQHLGSASNGGSGGGGSGASDSGGNSGAGGGAGGGGGSGGVVALYSKTIVNNASPGIQAKGGTGGTGGTGGNGTGTGGNGANGTTAGDGVVGQIWLYQLA